MNPETLRCRILDYTKREMYQHGADGLTMDDIARGMKMSKRTLYKLFPSKTSLFRVCLSDFANGIRSQIQQKQIRMADVRIVAATNENLERAIKEGRFREDLYHRLAEMEIRMPSLAECADDILPLAEFFRERFSKELKKETKGFSKDAIYRLRSYRWPGNVRELQNRIKRAVLLTETDRKSVV